MSIKTIISTVLIMASGSLLANSDLVSREKEIMNSSEISAFNTSLYATSPLLHDVTTRILALEQLEDIKILLQKIADNQKCEQKG